MAARLVQLCTGSVLQVWWVSRQQVALNIPSFTGAATAGVNGGAPLLHFSSWLQTPR